MNKNVMALQKLYMDINNEKAGKTEWLECSYKKFTLLLF